jgi:hypothetical protein
MPFRKTTQGRCHCGNLELILESSVPLDDLPLRACQCSFCVRHGARNTVDPNGKVTVICHDTSHLIRYQFALKTCEFLICGYCGIYVCAVLTDGAESWSTLNVNTLQAPGRFNRPATPVSYDAENQPERVDRRKRTWTPTELRLGSG